MRKVMLVAAVVIMVCVSVGTADAITVQIYQCTSFQTGCTTLLKTLGGATATSVGLAGTYNQLSILSGSVAISQTSTVKNMRLSAVLRGGSTGGAFLIRMETGPLQYGLQPAGKNYPNSVALDGSWIGATTPQIKAVLTANLGNATYQSTVDQPSALPTVTVVFNGTLFSRLSNTKTESIYLPPSSPSVSCTDPSTGQSVNCNRNRHRKDLFVAIRANQTINMAETLVTAFSEHDVANGGRAEVNQFLLCRDEGKQFQMGTTSAEKNYLMTPHAPLATDPNRPNSAPPTFPAQFDPALAPKDGTETLVSLPNDNDPSNDSQFNLFLPCQPTTFGDVSYLSATFRPLDPFTVDGIPSDACKGTLRWVFDLVDKNNEHTIVEVLYGSVTNNFDGCSAYNGVNILASSEARFFVDGEFKTRNQLNSLNKDLVASIKLDLDGRRVVVGEPIDITVVLASLQVNNDTYSFPTQTQVAYCPPVSPDHGFGIQITRIDPTTFVPTDPPTVILQDRVSVSGCKISVNVDTRVDTVGQGLYRIEVLNNLTVQDEPGFIVLNAQ